MPNSYKDSAHMPRISSFEVTVDDHVMEIDADPLSALFELASMMGDHQASAPDTMVMGWPVARALRDHPIGGTMTFTQGSPAGLFDHVPTPRQRSPKRRDTKPARKPRIKDRRSPRHTQRRK